MFPKFFNFFMKSRIVNTSRQLEIDIARGLAVLFMMLVHVSGEFMDTPSGDTLFGKIIDFLGSVPAAPVFMFVMGVGFVYSKNQSPAKLFKRGLLIFAGGYVLNFLRGFLPFFIGSQLGYYPLTLDNLPWYFYLVQVDILQFAGLSMIFVSLLKYIKLKEIYYPIVAIAFGVLSPFVWGIGTGLKLPDLLLMCLFGKKGFTFHPFFSWIFYPLMGAFFGWLLLQVNNKNKFYLIVTAFALPVMVIGSVLGFALHYDFGIVIGSINNYYLHGIFSNIIFVSFVLCWLSLWHFIGKVLPTLIMNRLLFWSKAVTVVYVVHWLFLGWFEFLVFDEFGIVEAVLAMIILVFITDRTTDLYYKIKARLQDHSEKDQTVVTNLNNPIN